MANNPDETQDNVQRPTGIRRAVKLVVPVVDAFISVLVLAPLVVSYWRGTFYLLEMYIFPCAKPLEDPPLLHSLIFSLVLGITGGMFFCYAQNWFMKTICGRKSPIAELFWKRVYTYIFGIILVNHWRGVWGLLDMFTKSEPLNEMWSGIMSFSIGTFLLLCLKCYRNCLSPPLAAASDLDDYFFVIDTRFRVKRNRHVLYFLDVLFSIAVPGSLIVFVVRGAFSMLNNLYTLTGMELMTYPLYLTTWSIGMGLVVVSLLLQKPCAQVSIALENKNHWLLKILFEDLYMFVCFAAGIHVWHSIWGFCDVFIYSHNMELSSWICHAFGLGGLMLLFHGSSILIKGYQIDGEFSNGDGCWLPAKSLTIFDFDPAERKDRNQQMREMYGKKRKEVHDLMNGEADYAGGFERRLTVQLEEGGRVQDGKIYKPVLAKMEDVDA